MRVEEILKAKGREVATISPDATVRDVVAALAEHQVGALVVSGDGRRIDGIVSERDVVRRLATSGADLLELSVRDIMSSRVHCCSPGHAVDGLMGLMTERRIRHVPVIDDDQLAGIISIGDVVKHHVADLESEREHLERYVTTGW